MKYKLLKESKNLEETLIEKTGFKHEFTVLSVLEHIVELRKKLKEFAGQKKLELAKIANIQRNNPFIKDLTDEQKHAVWMYYESKKVADICVRGTETHNEALAEYDQVIEDIRKQTGYKIKVPLAIWKSPKK